MVNEMKCSKLNETKPVRSSKTIIKPSSVRARVAINNENKITDDSTKKVSDETNLIPMIQEKQSGVVNKIGVTLNEPDDQDMNQKEINDSATILNQEETQNKEQISNETEKTLEAKYIKFDPQEVMFYNRVNSFFKSLEEKKFKHMVDILNGKADISLRLLEWFITKYCDKYKTTKCVKENKESFVIYVGYKAALKTYRKRYFDPFKRNQQEKKQKFCYMCVKNGKEYKVNTTLGQLHFFRWLFENNILNYIVANLDSIKASMEHMNRLEKKRKDEDKKNGIKKTKKKPEHNKINKTTASNNVEITTNDSKGKSSLVISFD